MLGVVPQCGLDVLDGGGDVVCEEEDECSAGEYFGRAWF